MSLPTENTPENTQNSDLLYLSKLEFKPEFRKGFLNFFVSKFKVVILLIMVIMSWGTYAFFALPRESDPEVKIAMAVVTVIYPGASPGDMEELITKKIETEISGITGIDKITSTSANSLSSIVVQFDSKEDLDDAIRRLKDKVSSITDLPEEAKDPIVSEIALDDQPIMTAVITGDYDQMTLRDIAEEIKDELEKITGIREVRLSGGDEREFSVAYDQAKLISFNLNTETVNQVIKSANLSIPAGTFKGEQFNFPVRADARFYTAQAIGELPIFHTPNGALVKVKDVAEVKETAIEKTVYSRLSIAGAEPKESVTINLIKRTGGSILETVAEADQVIQNEIQEYGANLNYNISFDKSQYIKDNFDQLSHDLVLTIFLVFSILLLIVGLKEAVVASMAIPLVFSVSFGVMLLTGISLNFLSLFSLILSLGMLVDDAIVVVSATKQYMRTGRFTPEEAVLLVLNDFKVVLFSTTLTTVWAFLPLLMSEGIIGEYIKSIPITMSVTLISSLLIALIINHPLAAVLERWRLTKGFFWFVIVVLTWVGLHFLFSAGFVAKIAGLLALVLVGRMLFLYFVKKWSRTLKQNSFLMEQEWLDDDLIKQKLKSANHSTDKTWFQRLLHGVVPFYKILPFYEKCLNYVIQTKKHAILTILAVFVLFVTSVMLPVSGALPNEFFPVTDEDMVFIDVEGPAGLKLDETDQILTEIENRLLKYKEIKNFTTSVGAPSQNSQISSGSNSENLGSITIKLVEKEKRKTKSYELAMLIRQDLQNITEAKISVDSMQSGPPSGAAVDAQISGDDLLVLDQIANDLKAILVEIPGVINADISLKEAPAEYTFNLDHTKIEMYDLSIGLVAGTIRTGLAGTEVTKILIDGNEIKVVARFDKTKIDTLTDWQNLQIVNKKGEPVFLKEVAQIELKPSLDSISRIDQKRVVRVTAGTEGTTRSAEVIADFSQRIAQNYKMPEGYSLSFGGENEENAKSVRSILMAMILAGILIISTLVIQFNSFTKALIVLTTIPLALTGVFFGMTLTQIAISFPGLIGILALFGIVVKNAIILVDKINLNLRSGITFKNAIIDAGKSRLEAIIITSISTILGILPVTLSDEVWKALGSAVIFGLTLSSFLTLFIVPALFYLLIKPTDRG